MINFNFYKYGGNTKNQVSSRIKGKVQTKQITLNLVICKLF